MNLEPQYDPQKAAWSEPVEYDLTLLLVDYREGLPVDEERVRDYRWALNVNKAKKLTERDLRKKRRRIFFVNCFPVIPATAENTVHYEDDQ